MAKINTTIHDNFIRAILADKEIARAYFSNFLPLLVSDHLEFSTLTQMPETYLSKNLQKTMSDIVYSCKTKDDAEIKVCLLIEHKSYIDKYTPIQIGSYIFSGYEKQIANKENLSIIIPVLLYHGKAKWQYQTLSSLFNNLDQNDKQSVWKKFLPNFDYVYNNLGEISDEHIEILENKFLTASLLSLKHKVMSTLEIFEKKGLDRGIEKGIEQGIEKGIELSKISFIKNLLSNTDFTITKIAMLAEVSEELVSKIRSEIDLKK